MVHQGLAVVGMVRKIGQAINLCSAIRFVRVLGTVLIVLTVRLQGLTNLSEVRLKSKFRCTCTRCLCILIISNFMPCATEVNESHHYIIVILSITRIPRPDHSTGICILQFIFSYFDSFITSVVSAPEPVLTENTIECGVMRTSGSGYKQSFLIPFTT
jgi:hypothetical protein